MTSPAFDAATQHRVQDLAKAEAERLRHEAMRDFWRGANAIWQRGQATAQRSSARLQARLTRHARNRAAPDSTATSGTGACQHCH